MTDQQSTADAEFAAMQTIYACLEQLDEPARERVVGYVANRLGIAPTKTHVSKPKVQQGQESDAGHEASDEDAATSPPLKFSTLAELSDAAGPQSNSDKALVAAYWVQVCGGKENFDSQSVNTGLKNLGHGLPNVTAALTDLQERKPAHVLQLKKSGSSKQSRKTYKLTVAGIKAVEDMLGG